MCCCCGHSQNSYRQCLSSNAKKVSVMTKNVAQEDIIDTTDCPDCSYRGSSPFSLSRHRVGHTGEFKCDDCGKGFVRLENKLTHTRTCDGQNWNKKHSERADRTFRQDQTFPPGPSVYSPPAPGLSQHSLQSPLAPGPSLHSPPAPGPSLHSPPAPGHPLPAAKTTLTSTPAPSYPGPLAAYIDQPNLLHPNVPYMLAPHPGPPLYVSFLLPPVHVALSGPPRPPNQGGPLSPPSQGGLLNPGWSYLSYKPWSSLWIPSWSSQPRRSSRSYKPWRSLWSSQLWISPWSSAWPPSWS